MNYCKSYLFVFLFVLTSLVAQKDYSGSLDSLWTYQELPNELAKESIVILEEEINMYITAYSPIFISKKAFYINSEKAGDEIQQVLNKDLYSAYSIYVYKADGSSYGLDDQNAIAQKVYEGKKFKAEREKYVLPKLEVGDNLVWVQSGIGMNHSVPIYNSFYTINKKVDIKVDGFFGHTFLKTDTIGEFKKTALKEDVLYQLKFENLEAREWEPNSVEEDRNKVIKILLNSFGSSSVGFALLRMFEGEISFCEREQLNEIHYKNLIKGVKKKSGNVITQLTMIDKMVNEYKVGYLSEGSRQSFGNMVMQKVIPKQFYLAFMAKTLKELDINYEWGYTKSKYIGAIYTQDIAYDDKCQKFLVFYDYESQPHYIFEPNYTQYYKIDEIPGQFEGCTAFILSKKDAGVMYEVEKKILMLPVTEPKYNYAKNIVQVHVDFENNKADVDYRLFTSGIFTQDIAPYFKKWSQSQDQSSIEHLFFDENNWTYVSTQKDSSHYYYPFKYEGEWKLILKEPSMELDDSLYQIGLNLFDFILISSFKEQDRTSDVLMGNVSKQSERLIFTFNQPVSLENAAELSQEYAFDQGKVVFKTQQINETTISIMINFIIGSDFISKENYHHLFQQRKEYISMLNKSLIVKLK